MLPTPESDPSVRVSAESVDKAVLDARLRLASIVDSSGDPIISKDLEGTILSWNPAATRVFGYEPDEIIGRSILTLIPSELRSDEDEILRQIKAGHRVEHFETVRLRKNGERIPVSVSISPIRDKTGAIVGAAKIARDISGKKKIEESRFLLATIVDSADDAIISKDLSGIVKTWNEGARKMFGYTADEMIGKSILTLIPEALRYEEDGILQKLRSGQRIDHYETTRQKKDGRAVDVSVTISPIRNELGVVIGASKIARDISDRKQVERLLLQSEKLAATGRMAAAVAHEINNPLESLMNVIFLARQYSAEDSRIYKLLVTAEEELERVAHIARQTLGYYKDSGSPTEVYVHDLLENVLNVYNAKMVAGSIAVERQFNDLQKIVLSKGEMIQVLSNIIANAVDAMPRGGILSVSSRKLLRVPNDGIQVVIRDTGAGIETENAARVFEPFFTTKGNLGTGIGLWVAKQLVERRGGSIAIASSTSAQGSGTSVTIFIPFTQLVTFVGTPDEKAPTS